jgi:hypothetical protein
LYALQKFILAKLDTSSGEVEKATIKSCIDYINNICDEYSAYRADEDNMVLFGGELELQDIKRSVC